MVSYDVDMRNSIHHESDRTVGGFDISVEEWADLEIDTSILSIPSIQPILDPDPIEWYIPTSSGLDNIASPVVALPRIFSDKEGYIPFYITELESSIVYRGRKHCKTFTLEQSETGFDSVGSEFEVEEVPPSEEIDVTRYGFVPPTKTEPIAFMSTAFVNAKRVIFPEVTGVDVSSIYVIPDELLVKICGLEGPYTSAMV